MISLTGQQEAPWSDVITFRGDTINSRFVAETDGHRVAESALAGDPEQENWGFRFTVRVYFNIQNDNYCYNVGVTAQCTRRATTQNLVALFLRVRDVQVMPKLFLLFTCTRYLVP